MSAFGQLSARLCTYNQYYCEVGQNYEIFLISHEYSAKFIINHADQKYIVYFLKYLFRDIYVFVSTFENVYRLIVSVCLFLKISKVDTQT